MASKIADVEKLKGLWSYVNGENFDEYLKAVGISWLIRQAVKAVTAEKVTISEDSNGRWTLKSESTFKNTEYEFTPGVEFDELRGDGVVVKSTITFDDNTGHWMHLAIDREGKKVYIERYVDDNDQQQVDLKCEGVKARRWYKRIE